MLDIGRSLLLPVSLLAITVPMFVWNFASQGERHHEMDDILPEFVAMKQSSGDVLAVARHEITVGQWETCVRDGHCREAVKLTAHNSEHPITSVNWFDVQDYISWARSITEISYRLPTRQEWLEFSSNHAPVPRKKLFEDPRLAWAADYDLEAEPMSRITSPAGSYGTNQLGLSDIKGNVWEWTATQCGSLETGKTEDCRSGRVAMGEHMAVLSDFVRDPGNASCGAGLPPANLGFRLVY